MGPCHSFSPEFVNNLELFGLSWQLFLNVISRENVLKIHPLFLTRIPFIYNITVQIESLLPLFNTISDIICKLGPNHRVDSNRVIFKLSCHFLTSSQNKVLSIISVSKDNEESFLPSSLNFL